MWKKDLLRFNIHSDIKNKVANQERERHYLNLINSTSNKNLQQTELLMMKTQKCFLSSQKQAKAVPPPHLFNTEPKGRQLSKK